MTGEARFLTKNWQPKFGPNGSGPKLVFFHFVKFVSLIFFEIAYNDNLKQCLTSGRGTIYEKNCGTKLCQNRPKWGPELGFLPFSQV